MRKLIVSEFMTLDRAGKRVLPQGVHKKFKLKSARPYPTGVVGLHYILQA